MKLLQQTLYIVTLIVATTLNAQETTTGTGSNTIDDQFTEVIEGSNNYQKFKVIEKTKMTRLQANTKKRIDGLQDDIKNLKAEMSEQQTAALKVSADLESTQKELEASLAEKDSINFFGILMKKEAYQTMMWGIIGALLLGLIFFIFKFKRSNILTKEAQYKLEETDVNFEEYRRKALEKEQKLGRQLQDERNRALKSMKN